MSDDNQSKEKIQAVILAAGKATRTEPLTAGKAKALLPVLDGTIMTKILDAAQPLIDEAIIVIGHLKEQVISALGSEYKGVKLTYVEQEEQLGTGHALLCAEPHIKDRFIILTGDDIISPKDLQNLTRHRYACLANEVKDPSRFGIFTIDADNNITDIEEKPDQPKSNLANTAIWVMDRRLLTLMKAQGKTERDEFEVTCALGALIKEEKVYCQPVQDYWIPITYPWNLLEANVHFLRQIEECRIDGVVEPGAVVKGCVHIGKGTTVKAGTCIEGPAYIGNDCTIGPHAYIRKDTIILDNVNTRGELYDVLIMSGTTAKHPCYLSHGIVGEDCNIGYGTVFADYRHDAGSNMTVIKGQKIDSGRRKLGAFLGHRVHTGIGTLIYPGRKLWPHTTTLPGEIVKKDIHESEHMTTHKR